MKWFLVPFFLTSFALVENPQDQQVVRNAYAKLAYAVQSRVVYQEAQKNPNLTSTELAKKLQENELRFDIPEMSSGPLSDIELRPYLDFVTQTDTQPTLQITYAVQTHQEMGGNRYTTLFASANWYTPDGSQTLANFNPTLKEFLSQAKLTAYSRYVAATITVRFQNQSRTYHTLWLFGDDVYCIDRITGGSGEPKNYMKEDLYPSVLTDTSLRSHAAVNEWLNSTQRFEASCKKGKQDVCCDSATMHCGVHADDLRSTKPAPNTEIAHKGGL